MAERLAIITPSYIRDLERCRLTVESVQRFLPDSARHYLIIDRRDVPAFRPLEGGRTQILVAEDLLPWWIRRIPRVRKVWLSLGTIPLRSWIVQQLIKLSAASAVQEQTLAFVDSDVAFIRPVTMDMLVRDGKTRLFRRPGHADQPMHHRWHRTAARLLGLPQRDYFGADYIGNCITWRRDTLLSMQRHIEQETGRSWLRAVAGQWHLSEYILYGVYVDHVLGREQAGHYSEERDLCHCSWDYTIESRQELDDFLAQDLDEHVRAVLVQSNLRLPPDTYLNAIRRLQDSADAATASSS